MDKWIDASIKCEHISQDECLNQHWFRNVKDAQETIEAWRVDYNDHRLHSALRQQMPTAYAQMMEHPLTAIG